MENIFLQLIDVSDDRLISGLGIYDFNGRKTG